jgi:hypothetical protein
LGTSNTSKHAEDLTQLVNAAPIRSEAGDFLLLRIDIEGKRDTLKAQA